MSAVLSFSTSLALPIGVHHLIVVGHTTSLLGERLQTQLPEAVKPVWKSMVGSLRPGDAGSTATSFVVSTDPETLVKVSVVCLPDECSRHNSPAHPHAIAQHVGDLGAGEAKPVALWLALAQAEHAMASVCAVARAFPLFSLKTPSDKSSAETDAGNSQIAVGLHADAGELRENVVGWSRAAEHVRLAARLVDSPTSVLHTDAFVAEARQVAEACGAKILVKRGEELRSQGFGGLWNVGRAATPGPALVVLSHEPEGSSRTVAWVGKGIVYDTGGLSIKTKNGMVGMKTDMGGAAAVLAAFGAAVAGGCKDRLYAVLCMAENAISSSAFRPDDIITLYSGKTVEINNTDAEGRLVLGDGVAYAVKHLEPDVIVDMATLTGAQLIATGQRHAAIYCNDEGLERRAIAAGQACGDLVHPLPYCPEFFRAEFKSKIADMKNSVKDRMNAQSSCAGQFVGNHLGDYSGEWLHIDIAGPSTASDRGTGYGVALLLELLAAT